MKHLFTRAFRQPVLHPFWRLDSKVLKKVFIPFIIFLDFGFLYAQDYTVTLDNDPKTEQGVTFDLSGSASVAFGAYSMSTTEAKTATISISQKIDVKSVYFSWGENVQGASLEFYNGSTLVKSITWGSTGSTKTVNASKIDKIIMREDGTSSNGAGDLQKITFSISPASEAPTVTTTTPSSIGQSTATLGGEVTDNGGESVTERGVVYSTSSNPTTSDTKVQIGSGTGTFSQGVTGLSESTQYYVRAYAINSIGTSYGSEETFTTLSGGRGGGGDTNPPTFDVAPSLSNISTTFLSLNASIDEAGTIYYVTVADGATAPTASEVKAGTASGGGLAVSSGNLAVSSGDFSGAFTISGLSANTDYDIYVVAEDDEGTPNLQTSPTKKDVQTNSNNALYFDSDAKVSGLDGPNPTNFTVEFNIYLDQLAPGGDWQGIYYNSSDDTGFFVDDQNRLVLYVTQSAHYRFETAFDLKTWTHVAFTYNNATNTVTGYLDGQVVSVTSQSNASSETMTLPTANVTMGYGPGNYGDYSLFTGALDDFRIWNDVRTSSEIDTNKDTELTNADDVNLLRYYDFNQGIGGQDNSSEASLIDRTGNSSGGSLANFTLNGDVSNWVAFSSLGGSTVPTVTTSTATSITSSEATLNGEVTADGDATITERGFIYALTSDDATPTVAEVNGTTVFKQTSSGTTGAFNETVSGLSASSEYSYVAYATNSEGTAEGSVQTFTTNTSEELFDFESGSASYSGWDTKTLTIDDNTLSLSFTVQATADKVLKGSESGWAYNGSEGLYFGWDYLETQMDFGIETGYSFDLKGFYISHQGDGGSNPTDYTLSSDKGSITINPPLDGSGSLTYIDVAGNGNSAYFEGISSFSLQAPGSGAYFEIDDITIANVQSAITAPTISTSTATSITTSEATLNGEVTADGDATITERGFIYALTSDDATPTVAEVNGTTVFKQTSSGTTGAFNETVSGLSASSEYSYVAYATNSVGTTEGGVESFTTLAANCAPTIGTTTFDGPGESIASYSTAPITGTVECWDVTLEGGNGSIYHYGNNSPGYLSLVINPATSISIKSNDGSEFELKSFTSRWYSFSGSYTLTGYKDGVAQGSSSATVSETGSFFLTDISASTAFDDIDEFVLTGFGSSNVTLQLDDIVIGDVNDGSSPIINTSTASSVFSIEATLNGEVTSDGGATITERGFVYALTSDDSTPTVAEVNGTTVFKQTSSGTTGAFNETITGLSASSGYSYVAYATNSVGTTEGSVETFTTTGSTGSIVITSETSSSSEEWTLAGGILKPLTDGAKVNLNEVETALASGSLQIQAPVDIIIEADITNTLSSEQALTLKADRNVILNPGVSLTATNFPLNMIFWADADGDDDGVVWLNWDVSNSGTTVNTNGGDLWMGGGSGTVTWNGLSVGDGVARGNNDNANGITLIQSTIETHGGNMAFYGRGGTNISVTIDAPGTGSGTITSNGNNNGIRLLGGNSIDADGGKIYMYGYADDPSSSANGVELSQTNSGGGDLISSSNSADDAIVIEGYAENNSSAANSWGFYTHYSTIQNIGGGGIHIKGSGAKNAGVTVATDGALLANSGKITLEGIGAGTGNPEVLIQGAIGQKAGTSVVSSSADIVIIGDQLTISGTSPNGIVSSSGILTVRPYTAGIDIGVGSGSNTLQLPASYFNTYFADGFSEIIVGDENSSLITIEGSTIYNDPLTLKTDASIVFSSTGDLSSTVANGLTLWSRANGNNEANDSNFGAVWMQQGSAINTGGGNLTMGGGQDPQIGYALGDNSAPSGENNARYRGVAMNGSVDAAGGNIIINGSAYTNATHSRGVSLGGPVKTNGAGTITVRGIGRGVSDAIALGDSYFTPDAVGTLDAGSGNINLFAEPGSSTSKGLNISTDGSYVSTTGNFSISTTGRISATSGLLNIGGTTNLEAGADIVLTHASNDFNGNISVTNATDVQIMDQNDLSLGGISVSGSIDIATLSGNLTLTNNITTTSATSDAIKLFADKNKSAGDDSGGNIKISGTPTISTGVGGQAKLHSGSASGSADLISLVGKSQTRYNVDAATSVFDPVLTSGNYALIRGLEPPFVQFSNASSSGAESVSSAVLSVELSNTSSTDISVDYAITGTATGSGTDYTLADGTLTISAGNLGGDITISGIVDDAILETDEAVIVTLSNPSDNAILGTNEVHTYTINDNDNASVTIADISGNEDDGAITLTATLDNAVDGGFTLDVSTADGTATAATDYTAISSEALTFSGTAGETQTFTIRPTVDSKVESTETLTVSMNNLGSTSLSISITDEAIVSITNDDYAPVFTSDISVDISENITSVQDIIATDANVGETITYSISGGTDDTQFSIDATTGALSFTSVPDYEDPADSDRDNVYNIQITATDGTNSTDQVIAVTVKNENDNFPVCTSPNTANIDENTTIVFTVTARDADAGSSITYSLIGGDDQSKFNINSSTGALAFASAPDYENTTDSNGDNDYLVTVRASDGTKSTDQTITISVQDANDNSPVITSTNTANTEENTTTVKTVTAIDADVTSNITYSISGGTDQGLFSIGNTSGVLTFDTAPDAEIPSDSDKDNEYVVEITATDGTNSDVQTITITVTDINDNAPVISGTFTGDITEGFPEEIVTVSGTISISDADADDTPEFSAIDASAGEKEYGVFSLTGTTWTYTLDHGAVEHLDAVDQVVDNIILSASDGSSQAIAITITGKDPDNDRDGSSDYVDTDDDNDGTLDEDDAFPFDETEDTDTDNDGTGNNADTDDDNDGTEDEEDAFPLDPLEDTDTDGDGIGNNSDTDDDNDGTEDILDAFPLDPAEDTDTDDDGIGNNADTDDDNDGIKDGEDAFPLDPSEDTDTDGDGIGNNSDTDDDNDGTEDILDAFPLDPAEDTDTDDDGIGNNADTDDDNDGTEDGEDAFPLDPAEDTDTDGDGIGNNADNDDDNDGTPDVDDAFPLDPNEDTDTDNDGIGNNEDTNDDNDIFDDVDDEFPLIPNGTSDMDGDGISDSDEGLADNDQDGIPNYMDDDSDDDGTSDSEEGIEDCDQDGIPDYLDPYSCEDLMTRKVLTANNDGFNDEFIIEGIDKFPNNKVIIYNRWGAVVWEIQGYDNDDPQKNFSGISNKLNSSNTLPGGTYFYVIIRDGEKPQKGFFVLN